MRRIPALIALAVLGLSTGACRGQEPPPPPPIPPVATAEVDGGHCVLKSTRYGDQVRFDLCAEAEGHIFAIYKEMDPNTFQDRLVAAFGPVQNRPAGKDGEPVLFAELRPLRVISAKGDAWCCSLVTVAWPDGSEKVLAIFGAGQPSLFGSRVTAIEEVPEKAMRLIPDGCDLIHYGSAGNDTILVYGEPDPPPPPKDDIEEMVREMYPSLAVKIHVLRGEDADSLREEEASKTYTYGGGAYVYVELKSGKTLLFLARSAELPIYGTFLDTFYYYNENDRGY